jgi:hypothetical protein
VFETEHLCRWVASMRQRLVGEADWQGCEVSELEAPRSPFMAVSMSPDGSRAAVAMAWPRADETYGLRLLFDVTGSPINADRLGQDVAKKARELGVRMTGFDPLTDALLAKHFVRTEAIAGREVRECLGPLRLAARGPAAQDRMDRLRRDRHGPDLDDPQGSRRVGVVPGGPWGRQPPDPRGSRSDPGGLPRLGPAARCDQPDP